MTEQVETQKVIALSELKPIESSGEGIDLNKYHKKNVKVEKAEVVQVNSAYTDCGKQWVLKVSSEVLERLTRDNEADIEFRASELFNLMQSKEGKLLGYPESKDSNLGKFMADLRVDAPEKIIGATATIKAYEKEVEGNVRTYLKFLY